MSTCSFLNRLITKMSRVFSACLVSYATETAMQICHGKRRCTITADATTFGNPCRADSRMYLKTVYTCGKYAIKVFIRSGIHFRWKTVMWCGSGFWEPTATRKRNPTLWTGSHRIGVFFGHSDGGFGNGPDDKRTNNFIKTFTFEHL